MGKYKFVLPYDEEAKLNPAEREKYYNELRKEFANMPNFKLRFSTLIQRTLHRPIKFILKHGGSKIFGFELNVNKDYLSEDSSKESKIYISSHQNFYDIINVINAIPGPVVIMNSIKVPFIIKMLLRVNGVIFIDRQDKDSAFDGKNEAMEYLAKGYSIVVFSEATLNGSPNKYNLPFCHGAFDMSQKMQRSVVPVVQYYNLDLNSDKINPVASCSLKFLPEINIPIINDRNDLYYYVDLVRDNMATCKHAMMEESYLACSQPLSNLSIGEEKQAVSFCQLKERLVSSKESSIAAIHNDFDRVLNIIISKKKKSKSEMSGVSVNDLVLSEEELENAKIEAETLINSRIREFEEIVNGLLSDIENENILKFVSANESDMKKKTLLYRKFVIGQFATFKDMGVTYQGDELVSIQNRYYSTILGGQKQNIDYKNPPINIVAWNPDTYELLDCGIKEIYFKKDLEKETKRLLRQINGLLSIKLYFSGSKIIVDLKTKTDVNVESVRELIKSKFPSDVIKYYNVLIAVNGLLNGELLLDETKLDDEDVLIIPDYGCDNYSTEPHESDVTDLFDKDCSNKSINYFCGEFLKYGVFDAKLKDQFLEYHSKNEQYDIFELIDVVFAAGIISSRQRNKMLSIVCFETSTYSFKFDDIQQYNIENDPVLKTKKREKK